jgi:cupin superfamily acireductone dioxygenase involved in methionine salvage
MNKEQKQIKKIIDEAYSSLRCLNNITWTSYREDLFEMNKQDEKRHRFNRSSSDFEASINDCAKMFTVQNIAESLLNENQFKIRDLINIRKSCLYTQSVVENYKDKILEAWKDQDIKYLADLDYISLIDWKHYQEIISRRVA